MYFCWFFFFSFFLLLHSFLYFCERDRGIAPQQKCRLLSMSLARRTRNADPGELLSWTCQMIHRKRAETFCCCISHMKFRKKRRSIGMVGKQLGWSAGSRYIIASCRCGIPSPIHLLLIPSMCKFHSAMLAAPFLSLPFVSLSSFFFGWAN